MTRDATERVSSDVDSVTATDIAIPRARPNTHCTLTAMRRQEGSDAQRLRRAKQLLAGGGVSRDDSDDELGLEDIPWEYIYSKEGHDIIGARIGSFQCFLGDAVLLKAEGTKEAWVGLICAFNDLEADEQEDRESNEKAAYFMWFSSDREIRNKAKKRTDCLAVKWSDFHTRPVIFTDEV